MEVIEDPPDVFERVRPVLASGQLHDLPDVAVVLRRWLRVAVLDLGLDIAAYGNRKDFGFPQNVTLDPYQLVNATVRYRASPALTLQGRLENAFDEDYTLADGYRTEGRSYTIGVRYSFE